MGLSIGIVGLPNVGKSTLFNALTKNNVLAANYPFATITPNVGIVPVPDERLAKLAELYKPDKVVPAAVSFVDIAGLVRGASQGQGLGNQFLANIRETDAIAQVVRAFSDPNVTHVEGKINPAADIETINTELILADLQTVQNRLAKKEISNKAELEQIRQALDSGKLVRNVITTEAERSIPKDSSTTLGMTVRDLQLLTAKPFLFVFNLDESDLGNQKLQAEMAKLVAPDQAVFLCAQVEAQLMELPETEKSELLRELGQDQSGLEQLAQAGFTTLGLQTFLTAGPKEVRAWTIKKGATAPEAAGVIHTDFQKGFIKAQVVSYKDLIAAGSEAAAKAKGLVRLEGKDYLMRDGDVVEFKFNV